MSYTIAAGLLFGVMSLAMAFAWLIGRFPGQSLRIELTWALATGAAGVAAALWPVEGPPPVRQYIVGGLVGAWGLRLCVSHLFHHRRGREDSRYVEMRERWGRAWEAKLFLLLQVRGVAGGALAVAAMMAGRDASPYPSRLDRVGALLSLAAIAGSILADAQMRGFNHHRGYQRGTCDRGMWRLSRHPNYVCEWLFWCGISLIALAPTPRWGEDLYALAGPVVIYLLLNHVYGAPQTEAHMLETRGESYRLYQKRTRKFWPIPRF